MKTFVCKVGEQKRYLQNQLIVSMKAKLRKALILSVISLCICSSRNKILLNNRPSL